MQSAQLQQNIERIVAAALAEDVGPGDVTTEATVPAEARARATFLQKQPGCIYGLAAAEAVFRALDERARFRRLCVEGSWQEPVAELLSVEAHTRALLTGERSALNLLCHLSGIASMAAQAARSVAGTRAGVIDTRKTTPGLRALEKAAVAAGGAGNHRFGLYDAILIKDNHIAAAGSITAAIERARAAAPRLAASVEVEVRDSAEIDEALRAGAKRLLLDNMDDEQVRQAVAQVAGRARLEASGGVSLTRLRALAQTGVDCISMGSLTHSAPALDISMKIESIR